MKFAQNIYTKKLSFEKAEEEPKKKEIVSKIEELEKRSNGKSSRLKESNKIRCKM